MPETHVALHVHGAGGREPVHVEELASGRLRVLFSPGLVVGVAAGDEIELTDSDGHFRVIAHGGNIAVQLFSAEPVAAFKQELESDVRRFLAGTLDGGIERGLVFTIPVVTGLPAIEQFFDNFCREHPGVTWMFGNVYDPDTHLPLGWWNPPEQQSSKASWWRRFLHGRA